MSTKTISMVCHESNGGTVTIKQQYDEDCNWPAIAYQFLCLLHGMGYRLDIEDVGADIESFILATKNEEGNW